MRFNFLSLMLIFIIGFFCNTDLYPSIAQTKKPFYEVYARQETDEWKKKWYEDDASKARYRRAFKEPLPTDDEYYNSQVTKYKAFEKALPVIKKLNILKSLVGDVDYLMSLDEMKKIVKDKFDAIRATGKIKTEQEFETIKNDYVVQEPNSDIKDFPKNMDRIWGTEFIKDQIEKTKSGSFAPLDYVIVVNNKEPIRVQLNFTWPYSPQILELENAVTRFKKVKNAKEVGNSVSDSAHTFYYVDTAGQAGNQNVLEDTMANKKYIVNTELKSFEQYTDLVAGLSKEVQSEIEKIKSKIPNAPIDWSTQDFLSDLLTYAQERFKYLNPDIKDTYTVTVQ